MPKRFQDPLEELRDLIYETINSLSRIVSVCSLIVFLIFVAIWVLAGAYGFLTAPIGFKPGRQPGAIESFADAWWIPVVVVLTLSEAAALFTKMKLRSAKPSFNDPGYKWDGKAHDGHEHQQ
ncbi:MAG: hypothetical protein ROO76_03385 [Terriglobia bacterium]|nr:hypothetical protein [Terriglobia bacterium]